MTLVQVDEYAVALALWIASALVLLSKAVHWEGIRRHPKLTPYCRVMLIVAALLLIPLSVVWTQAKREDKSWSNLATAWSRYGVVASIPAPNINLPKPPPLPSVTPAQSILPTKPERMPIKQPSQRPFDLSGQRRNGFLSYLGTLWRVDVKAHRLVKTSGERDTIRIGCTYYSDTSCVAAGNFLLLFSEAGWKIDSNQVFREHPQIPIAGVAIVTKNIERSPDLPPHLGVWDTTTDLSLLSIWYAFCQMGIRPQFSGADDIAPGVLGVYFGIEPDKLNPVPKIEDVIKP